MMGELLVGLAATLLVLAAILLFVGIARRRSIERMTESNEDTWDKWPDELWTPFAHRSHSHLYRVDTSNETYLCTNIVHRGSYLTLEQADLTYPSTDKTATSVEVPIDDIATRERIGHIRYIKVGARMEQWTGRRWRSVREYRFRRIEWTASMDGDKWEWTEQLSSED